MDLNNDNNDFKLYILSYYSNAFKNIYCYNHVNIISHFIGPYYQTTSTTPQNEPSTSSSTTPSTSSPASLTNQYYSNSTITESPSL